MKKVDSFWFGVHDFFISRVILPSIFESYLYKNIKLTVCANNGDA